MQLGADPIQLNRLANSFEDVALALGDAVEALARQFRHVIWRGRDRDLCAESIGRIRSTTAEASRSFTNAADGLRRQADDQRRVSDSRLPAVGHAPETEVFRTQFGDGRRIVAIGDLASATHVAILVPGIGTDSGNFGSVLAAAERLQHEAAAAIGDPGDVAVVAWLGYDAPDGIDELRHRAEMLTSDAALRGAVQLRRFIADMPGNAPGSGRRDLDLTLVGHSYGSLVAANAASAPGVDRVLLLGSPGVGVDTAADLHLDPNTKVIAAAVRGDAVAQLGWFGARPTSDAFGGLVLDTRPVRGEHAPSLLHAHSSYFDAGSTSLANVAAATAGRPVRRADGRTVALAPPFSAAR